MSALHVLATTRWSEIRRLVITNIAKAKVEILGETENAMVGLCWLFVSVFCSGLNL